MNDVDETSPAQEILTAVEEHLKKAGYASPVSALGLSERDLRTEDKPGGRAGPFLVRTL